MAKHWDSFLSYCTISTGQLHKNFMKCTYYHFLQMPILIDIHFFLSYPL